MSQENNFVPEQGSYKPLTPFQLFVKSNFPFIEATYESLDNYGLYCKIVEYLNNVIENENTVEDNVTALYNAFVSLNTYVSNYFDNLDVQEEINNKLDEMVSTGELQELLTLQYDTLRQEVDENNQEIENQINIINGRIDDFTHLPSGSTSGDAELIDIRTGGNGVTYTSAGNSVRAQYTINHTEILNIENMYNKIKLDGLNGRFLRYDSELEQVLENTSSNQNLHVSYQMLSPKETIVLNSYITNTIPVLCVFYDVDNTEISYVENPFFSNEETSTYNIKQTFIVPANTYYAKISYTSLNNEISYLSRKIENIENSIVLNEIESNGNGYVYNTNWELQQTGVDSYTSYEIDCNAGDVIYLSTQNSQYIPAYNILNDDVSILTIGTSVQTAFPVTLEYQAYEISENNTKILVNVLDGKKIYKKVYNYTINELYNKVNKYIDVKVLDKDGNGDFTTFKSATEYTWTHPNTTVYVNAGEYNLAEEYGETYLNNVPNSYDYNHSIGPEIGNNAHFIFSSGAKLVFNYSGTNYSAVKFFSPINITGSCILENVNIECSNCRYCIHDDPPTVVQGAIKNVKVTYINCKLKHNGNTLGTYRETCCIGGGCTINSITRIYGGIFILESGLAAITYHHYSRGDGKEQEVLIENAYISGILQTSDYGHTSNSVILLNANNCSLSTDIVIGTYSESVLFNNEVRT